MLKWVSKHPILTFNILTILLCVIVGPHTVGAWYGHVIREIATGIVEFFRGMF